MLPSKDDLESARANSGRVELCGIDIVGVVLGVVDMLFGAVCPEPFCSDFKFGSSIAERHERQDPDQDTNGVRLDALQCPHVDRLRIIAEPWEPPVSIGMSVTSGSFVLTVAEICTFDHH